MKDEPKAEKPIPVIEAPATVVEPAKKLPEPAQVGDINTAPTTTKAEDDTKKGQRFVNLIWESNQGIISISVVCTTLFVATKLTMLSIDPEATDNQIIMADKALQLLISLVSGIIGFYFGRTNHVKTGGVATGDAGR